MAGRKFCSVQLELESPNKIEFVRYTSFVPQANNSRRGRPPREAVYERLGIQIGELHYRLGGGRRPLWRPRVSAGHLARRGRITRPRLKAILSFSSRSKRSSLRGRAVGNKELSEYLEVRGYADAADWVYGHAIQPDEWTSRGLITGVTELRHLHELTMTPVWVAPHPQATDREGPGSFREHDIHIYSPKA